MSATSAGIGSSAVVTDRVAGFDLLRGMCAIAVVVYHVLAWNNWAHLYTWGTYAVYLFFILSGASMWVAYSRRLAAGFPVAKFLGLRLARLLPLYLLALAAGLAMHSWRTGFDIRTASEGFLNLFFLFGLGNPGATSQVGGGWSLGIEFVFYLVFPVMLALLSGPRWWLVVLIAFASQYAFITAVFSNGKGLLDNFQSYTEFLAFLFYFAAGCVIGRAIVGGHLRAHWLGAPLLVGSLTVLGSVSGAQAELTLTGLAGMGLSLLAAAAVAAAAALPLRGSGGWIAEQLGKASYGVYILHPFMVGPARKISDAAGLGAAGIVVLTVITSVAFALLLERWYEQPMQRRLRPLLARDEPSWTGPSQEHRL